MKRITLEALVARHRDMTYEEQHSYIQNQLKSGALKPVKASGTNGKTPALHREYWIVEEKKDYSALQEELKYGLMHLLSVDYYFSHPETYQKDRPWVLMLNDYLLHRRSALAHRESVNERSFEIWNREKFLTKGPGRKILKRCGLDMEFLNVYETGEPLAYYSHTRAAPQNLLILENSLEQYVEVIKQDTQAEKILKESLFKIVKESQETVLFGCGQNGQRLYWLFIKENVDNKIAAFSDNDEKKWGMNLFDKEVLPPEQAIKRFHNATYLIANERHCYDLQRQLLEHGIKKDKIFICRYGLA